MIDIARQESTLANRPQKAVLLRQRRAMEWTRFDLNDAIGTNQGGQATQSSDAPPCGPGEMLLVEFAQRFCGSRVLRGRAQRTTVNLHGGATLVRHCGPGVC